MASQTSATDAPTNVEEETTVGTNEIDGDLTIQDRKEERLEEMVQSYEVFSLRSNCISRQNRRQPMSCCCLGVMKDKPERPSSSTHVVIKSAIIPSLSRLQVYCSSYLKHVLSSPYHCSLGTKR
jgi:hypothetical protein